LKSQRRSGRTSGAGGSVDHNSEVGIRNSESGISAQKKLGSDHSAFEQKAAFALNELQRKYSDLAPNKRVLIGVSGGRDSVALLHFLVAQGWKKLVVVHFNHGLRGRESGQDAAFVRRLAARYKLKFDTFKEDIKAFAEGLKMSLETAARIERDMFFHVIGQNHNTPYIFLGHHLEDNAETILGNIARGTGLRGVAGILPAAETFQKFTKLRPLLTVRRAEIDEYIAAHKLSFREDSSNKSPEHRRNRLRHEVLPLLNEVLQRDVAPLIVRMGSLAERDDNYLRELAADFIARHALIQPDNSLRITPELRALHGAIQSRVFIHWLTEKLKVPHLGNREIEAAMTMIQPEGPAKINLPGDRHLRRKAKRLYVQEPPPRWPWLKASEPG
jgi:tRNA(Ile)-lysidine synthase